MIYACGLLLVYYSLLVEFLTKYRGVFFVVISILFLGTISMFRGDVGTDTKSYESMVSLYRFGGNFEGWEPIFSGLIAGLQTFISSDRVVIRSFSLLFVLGLLWFLVKADRNEVHFISFFYLPAFFYSYSMNGLRVGMASICLLLMVQCARRGVHAKSVFWAVSSAGFHYSSMFSGFYLLLTILRWRIANLLVFSLFVVFSFFVAIYYNGGYFSNKAALYLDSESPASFSGLSKIASIVVLLVGVLLSDLPSQERIKIIVMGFLFSAVFYVMSFYSYAGLRFLDLLALALPLSVLSLYGRYGLLFSWSIKAGLLISGFLSAVAAYRGYILNYGVGDAPFLPYTFIW